MKVCRKGYTQASLLGRFRCPSRCNRLGSAPKVKENEVGSSFRPGKVLVSWTVGSS